MRIRQPGKIRDRLWLLGRKESCVYLVEGNKESMIVSGGMCYLVPDVIRQFEEFGIEETKIGKLLVLHAHFDHVGIVPFFKRRHPEIELFASQRAWEVLHLPEAIHTINQFSRDVTRQMGKKEVFTAYDLDWTDHIRGTCVYEGDRIDLGDIELTIYETPGHSSCSIAAYAPQLKALFASDSVGIPYKDMIITSGSSSFTKYQESLEKLKILDVDFVCADHYGYVAGKEARGFMEETIEAARDYRAMVEAVYKRSGSIEMAAREILDEFYRENPDYFLTREILEAVYRQMIRHIADDLKL